MNKKLLTLTLGMMATLTLSSCQSGGGSNTNSASDSSIGQSYDTEETPLVMSLQETDGVFNPFFSTNASDSTVVSMTQIGMIGNDRLGNPVVGEDEAVVVLDYETVQTRSGTNNDVIDTTTYNFVLKNNIKFSNGSPLTMKDVLFNLYVYLDPVYTGSSTIYSTDIVGLQEYRTGTANPDEQNRFEEKYRTIAEDRISYIIEASQAVFDANRGTTFTEETFRPLLVAEANSNPTLYSNVVADYDQALLFFREELNTDYTNSMDSYSDFTLGGHAGVFETDVEMFLYNEGAITYDKNLDEISCEFALDYTEVRSWTKERAITEIYNRTIPSRISEVLTYWNTSVTLTDYLMNAAMEADNTGDREFKNISGIRFANREQSVTVNGTTYGVPTYNSDGSVVNGSNEVLSITINGVDPKAIWNFAFTVAPLYYYSDTAHIEAFDYEENFGVEYRSQKFMDEVVKDPAKIGVPVGAGPYQASKRSGGTENITNGQFKDMNIIYYERNENFLMGSPIIKKLRYQIVSQNSVLNSLYTNAIDFVEPNAKPEIVSDVRNHGYESVNVQTAGYGYIGINAGKVPSVAVRRAIMHAINTELCIQYYVTTAKRIYRPMSLSSWAYPEDAEVVYEYDGTGATSAELVRRAGYTAGGDGILQKDGDKLQYTFTVAGEVIDHPAWQALYNAAQILNKIGFQINVTTDANALSKLTNGSLTVWAAAWSSTIDPDMYQVYHMDSKATSVANWGYKQILINSGNKYAYELDTITQLSDVIDRARETEVRSTRIELYSEALDMVMDLAIELPTYQRDDLFAFNQKKIKRSSLTAEAELSPYNGLLSKIWLVDFN